MPNSSEIQSQRDRLERLRSEIHFHNYRYHVLDAPLISDFDFDRLMAELRQIEENHPDWVSPDSPTQRVGGQPADKFNKLPHPAPILSLANGFSADEVRQWYERILRLDARVARAKFVVEPKIDGLSVVLHYRDGSLVQGATRGDGEVGEEVTTNLRTIRRIPLRIPVAPDGPPSPTTIVVRGEVFINIHEFEALNRRLEQEGEKTYQNPRNTAAGFTLNLFQGLMFRDSEPTFRMTNRIGFLIDHSLCNSICHFFCAFGTRAFIPTLLGGVFRSYLIEGGLS